MKLARKQVTWGLIITLMLPLVFSSGCVLSHMIYVLKGGKVKPAYGGLAGQKVAIICLTDAESYGQDTLTTSVCKTVSLKLQSGVKKIQMISPTVVEDWMDNNDWNQVDFTKVGRAVGAQKVLAIHLNGYQIHEGSTLYKGRALVQMTVYDIENGGTVEFESGPEEYSFPTSGRPAIQTNDRNFEAIYLAKLTQYISNFYVEHDPLEQVADDASLLAF